jgi:hypothetical protein
VGAEHGRGFWGQVWTLNVVGSADSTLSDWVVDGYLGTGVARWLLLLGFVVGLWYVTLMGIVLHHSAGRHGAASALPGVVIGTIGVVTIVGCITAFVRRRTERNALGEMPR